MPEWESVVLGELLTRSRETVAVDPQKTYKQVTVRMKHKGVVLREEKSGATIGTTRQFLARPGQFIISSIDARNGANGLIPEALDGAIVTNDFWLFNVDETRLDQDWLDLYSSTPDFVEACTAASEGTTNRVRLKEDRFLALEIPLPPLPEQQRIVARAKGLLDKVEEARGLGVKVGEFSEQFVVALHCSLAGDRLVRVRDFLELEERKVAVEVGKEYPQVGVRSFGKGLFERETLNATQTTYKQFHQLYPSAVVLSQVKGWEGAIGVCPEHLTGRFASPEFRTFRCIEGEASAEYLDVLVSTEWFWSKLKDATRGVGARRERTRPEQFLNMVLPMPSLQAQEQAVKLLSKLHRATEYRKTYSPELDALPASILARAFAGAL